MGQLGASLSSFFCGYNPFCLIASVRASILAFTLPLAGAPAGALAGTGAEPLLPPAAQGAFEYGMPGPAGAGMLVAWAHGAAVPAAVGGTDVDERGNAEGLAF